MPDFRRPLALWLACVSLLVTVGSAGRCPAVEPGDRHPDLVMLDHEGYLALFRRQRRGDRLVLLPGERVFHASGKGDGPLRLSAGSARPAWFTIAKTVSGTSHLPAACHGRVAL